MHYTKPDSDSHTLQNLNQDALINPPTEASKSAEFSHLSLMEFINGNVHQRQHKEGTMRTILILQAVSLLFIGLYRWMYIHFLKKSEAYFSMLWLENCVVVFVLHIYLKRFSSTFSGTLPSIIRQMKALRIPILLYLFQTVILGFDFITFTRKAGGTEFYQFSTALSIPILLSLIHQFQFCVVPSYVYVLLSVSSGWKVMMLLQDVEFQMSYSFSIWCAVYTAVSCFFIILLKGHLKSNVIELLYYMLIPLVVILPILILSNDTINTSALSFTTILQVVVTGILLGILKSISTLTSLMLLKKGNPIVLLAVMNLSFFPDFLNQSLTYKLDCTLSALKVCLLYLLDFIIVQFELVSCVNNATVEVKLNEERKFSLMT